jgi:hypothetical protein
VTSCQGDSSRPYAFAIGGFNLLVLLVGAIIANQGKEISSRFDDANIRREFISIDTYNFAVSMLLAGSVVTLIPDLESQIFVCCFMILWVSTVGLMVLIVPKLHAFYDEWKGEAPAQTSSSSATSVELQPRNHRRTLSRNKSMSYDVQKNEQACNFILFFSVFFFCLELRRCNHANRLFDLIPLSSICSVSFAPIFISLNRNLLIPNMLSFNVHA